MKYRVFIEDVGSGRFSAYGTHDVDATSPLDAIFQVSGVVPSSRVGTRWQNATLRPRVDGLRLIALPHSRKDLWPHSRTGKVPTAALSYWFTE